MLTEINRLLDKWHRRAQKLLSGNEEGPRYEAAWVLDQCITELAVTFQQCDEAAPAALAEIRGIIRGEFGPGSYADMVVNIEITLDEYYGDADDPAT